MKQCDLKTGLSPSTVGSSSSSSLTASKSEHDDSFLGGLTLDLSFLSSDDQRSGIDDDDSLSNLSTKEGQLISNVAVDEKLDLSRANTTLLTERSSTHSYQDDSDDSEVICYVGRLSHKNLSSSGVTSRRSTDDLIGFYKLNPLAPQFIPSNSKKNLDTNGKRDKEGNSSSLKKSLSLPSSSGEFDLPEDGNNDAGRRESILVQNADENSGLLLPQDSLAKTMSMLDPLAPVFVPSSAKLSPLVHEKQGAFDTNAHSTTSSDNKLLNKVEVKIRSGEVGRSIKIRYPDGINESGSSRNKSTGQRRLNPLAPQFSLADTKPKAYDYEKSQAADDLSLVVNTSGLYPPIGYRDQNVVDADLAQSSVYGGRVLLNMSRGSSSLISPKTDGNVGSLKLIGVEPNNPSPKMDVTKLLTTMHGLSELLTLAHGSDSLNAQELDLINSTVQNLNSYIIQKQSGNQSITRHGSYDLNLLPNKSKLSIRELQLPRANNMTVDLDVKRKEKYSMVPDSSMCEFVTTNGNGFDQVVATSGYQQNHQSEEQINQHALFYKSLWLRAEADRCLMVYETSLTNPTS